MTLPSVFLVREHSSEQLTHPSLIIYLFLFSSSCKDNKPNKVLSFNLKVVLCCGVISLCYTMERNRGPGLDDAREEYLKRRRISSNLLLRSDMERGGKVGWWLLTI